MNWRTLLKISRPRFWTYLAGPFAVGFVAGASSLNDFLTPEPWLQLLFFIFPANLFLYGVNDWFDRETDALNEKKSTQEHRLLEQQRGDLRTWLIVTFFLAVVFFASLPLHSMIWMALFLFLSYSYSAPPLRWKSRPFLDSYSNVLYAIPAFLSYSLLTGEQLPWLVMLAAWTWTAGMHAFSAIPDILPDTKAGVSTIATKLGAKKSLVFVGLNWLFTSLVAVWLGGWLFAFVAVYPVLVGALLLKPQVKIEKVYWYLPALNTALGTVLFWYFGLAILL